MAGPCSDPCGARLWLERPAIYLQGKDPVYGAQMLIVYAAVSVLPAPAAGTAGPYAVLAGSACSFPLFRLPCALHLLGVPWSRTSHILRQGLVFDSCGARLWLGAPGHVLARERSRLRCPNVDRIRRCFRSSSPGCWYSGAIRGAGGQRVFLPFALPALRPSSAWCSVEQNQPYPMAGPCFAPCGARLWLGAPGHILARERSRLRCPNVDRIRRRFHSSNLGCRCSRAIRGVGGQRVFLPFVPSALCPSSAWCSV